MKPIRKIQIAAASALAGLFLWGCNEQVQTTGLPPATQGADAQSSTQTTASMTVPTTTNNLSTPATDPSSAPTSTAALASAPLPESALPAATNELPTAAPLPVTQQP